jgi:hypothetical protein
MLRVFASLTSFFLSYSKKNLKFYLLLLIRFIFTSQNRIIFLTSRILVNQTHFIFVNAAIKGSGIMCYIKVCNTIVRTQRIGASEPVAS